MATQALKGSAVLIYTPPGGVQTTHTLAVPLRRLEAIDSREKYQWWSGDRTTRETVVIGDGVREILGTIRFEDEPDLLKALLRAAIEDDVEVVYEESSGGTQYPHKVVEVVGSDGVRLQPDAERYSFGEYQCRLHLRRVDGGSFDGLL